MSNDDIKRAARAMAESDGFCWENCAQSYWIDHARIAKAALAARQDGADGHGLSIRIEQRPDGGIRVWSPQVRGLILSGSDPCKVMADVWPAITALLGHKRAHEQAGDQHGDR